MSVPGKDHIEGQGERLASEQARARVADSLAGDLAELPHLRHKRFASDRLRRDIVGATHTHRLASWIGTVLGAEENLAEGFLLVARRRQRDADIREGCRLLASWSAAEIRELEHFSGRFGLEEQPGKNRLRGALFHGLRPGAAGLMRDLQDLLLLATEVQSGWTALHLIAPELRDNDLRQAAELALDRTSRQMAWIRSHLKNTAPQALTVPADTRSELKAALPDPDIPIPYFGPGWVPVAAAVAAAGALGMLAMRRGKKR